MINQREKKRSSVFRSTYFHVGALFCIALLVRLLFLSHVGIWYDEAVSINFAEHSWSDFFAHRNSVKHLFFIILKLWIFLFGDTPFVVKLLPALVGAISIPLFYVLVKKVYNSRVAFWSSVFAALSCFNIIYSQQVKEYTLVLLFALLSVYILSINIKKEEGKVFSFSLVNMLLLLTHPIGYFVIGAEITYVLIMRKSLHPRFFKKLVMSLLLTVGSMVLLTRYIFWQDIPRMYLNYIENVQLKHLWKTVEAFSFGGMQQVQGGTGGEIQSQTIPFLHVLSIIEVLMVCFGFWKMWSDKKLFRNIFIYWLLAPLVGMYVWSKIFFNIYLVRYTIVALFPFYVFLSYGLASFSKKIMIGLGVIVITLNIISLQVYYTNTMPHVWRDVAKYSRSIIRNDDAIMFVPAEQLLPFWYYYKDVHKYRMQNIDLDFRKNEKAYYFYDSGNLIESIQKGNIEYYFSNNDASQRLSNSKNCLIILSPYWPGNKNAKKVISNAFAGKYVLKDEKKFDYVGVEALYFERVKS